MLNLNTHGSPASRPRGEVTSRSGSVQGRRSGEIMGIEEEDEDEIEEVEEFSPIMKPGEFVVEETTAEADKEEGKPPPLPLPTVKT